MTSMKFRCCAKTSNGNRCKNRTLLCQRVKNVEWYEQPFNMCYVHTQAVITVQRWWRDMKNSHSKDDSC